MVPVIVPPLEYKTDSEETEEQTLIPGRTRALAGRNQDKGHPGSRRNVAMVNPHVIRNLNTSYNTLLEEEEEQEDERQR